MTLGKSICLEVSLQKLSASFYNYDLYDVTLWLSNYLALDLLLNIVIGCTWQSSGVLNSFRKKRHAWIGEFIPLHAISMSTGKLSLSQRVLSYWAGTGKADSFAS